jgi:hypothetical protein
VIVDGRPITGYNLVVYARRAGAFEAVRPEAQIEEDLAFSGLP